MLKKFIVFIACQLVLIFSALAGEAKWLAPKGENVDRPNCWAAFRKDFKVDSVPQSAKAKIAADSKYWLWINGKLAVFEGGLKRGPNPNDTYFDEVDIAPFLKKGENKLAMLVWHFGKHGFSHKNSGKFGMLFELDTDSLKLASDSTWLSKVHPAYSSADNPPPNFRLPESNIKFDANKDIPGWQTADAKNLLGFEPSMEIGKDGDAPWNRLIKRPTPQWKDFGVRTAVFSRESGHKFDTVTAELPYNMQMTPIITLNDPRGGNLVDIMTDHTFAGGAQNLRAEYITKKGVQTYESLGWLNGEKIILNLPKDVKVESVQYRETGYDTELLGRFYCDDDFFAIFWEKAMRTLYVNMRDTYFDCPERERAQWWGDVVVLMGQSFYTYSTSAHALMRKAILELAAWQKQDGALFSPIPAGNYDSELPGQMLASIGRYGFWNYYMNTADIDTIKTVYPAVKKYLSLWTLDETGLTAFRKGGWTWGDWGENRDIRLIFAGWHYIALEAAANMADILNLPDDAKGYREIMSKVKDAYNKCWNGKEYRHPDYKLLTDDRVQALAVISGIADDSKYPQIKAFLRRNEHASPYMEKYVMESLFKMGDGVYGLERAKKRFGTMINDKRHTTLFEGWEIGTFGGGSINHAWSGGPITVISQYLCGIYPLEAGWKTFKIEPYPAGFKRASIEIPSIAGTVKSAFKIDGGEFILNVSVPQGTQAVVYMPEFTKGKSLSVNGSEDLDKFSSGKFKHASKATLLLPAGEYKISAR